MMNLSSSLTLMCHKFEGGIHLLSGGAILTRFISGKYKFVPTVGELFFRER